MLDLDATSTSNVVAMELSIQQTARIAGTTSRTLRYYDEIGLVPPSRIGSNGYRYYDDNALMRLQRVLLLRELALGLDQISEVLAREVEESAALTTHLYLLRQEQDRLTRQIAAVEHTIQSIIGKEELMAETMFDGFDHSQYKDEVEARWGKDARAESDSWWNLKSEHEQLAWQTELRVLNSDWIAAAEDPAITPQSSEARALAERHIAWLKSVPGAPSDDFTAYVTGLAEMYVYDERFAENYGGVEGATFVRDSLTSYLV